MDAAEAPEPPRPVSPEAFIESLDALAPDGAAPEALALAVSGGGDSVALLALAAAAARLRPLRLVAFTVDHGLRSESRAEAEAVGRAAARLGVAHEILDWRRAGSAPTANVQAEARAARYRLMRDRRQALRVGPLLTAHTVDDVVETFLIRLGRGSGVDGLAAMAARRVEDPAAAPPLEIWRPLLGVDRAALRATCRAHGLSWVEDPSNADERFARVRARHALAALAPLGLTRERLLKTARTMARARTALETATTDLLRTIARPAPASGAVQVDAARLAAAPREVALRALAALLARVGAAPFPPRLDALEAAFEALTQPAARTRTLLGCVLARDAEGALWVGREAAAAERRLVTPGDARDFVWDGRFRVALAPDAPRAAFEIAAVGSAALGACPKGAAAPAIVRAGAPAVWREGVFAGAPSLGAPCQGVAVAALPLVNG